MSKRVLDGVIKRVPISEKSAYLPMKRVSKTWPASRLREQAGSRWHNQASADFGEIGLLADETREQDMARRAACVSKRVLDGVTKRVPISEKSAYFPMKRVSKTWHGEPLV